MDLLPLLVVFGGFGVSVALGVLISLRATRRTARARSRTWREAARAAGLERVEEARGSLVGWSGDLHVRLSGFASGVLGGTRISVSGRGLPAGLTVRPEEPGESARPGGGREIETGDEAFDRAAWVEGPPAVVRSLLDAENRRALRGLVEGRLERKRLSPFWAPGQIHAGVLRVDALDGLPPGTGEEPPEVQRARRDGCVGSLHALAEVLHSVLELARRLQAPEDVPGRLAENLRSEPLAGVRLRVLTTLTRELPSHPTTREALLAAREDPDAEVRLRAGIALGPEGRDVLLAVASGEGAEDATTERAVAALAGQLTVPEAQGILRNALRTRREATARACLGVLGLRGGPDAIDTAAKVLAVEAGRRRGALAVAAADALGSTGDASAEAPLLAALGSPSSLVRVAVVRALGQVGTTAAVAPLKQAESSDPPVRVAARQAIAGIQSRARGAAPGQLSLAGRESGQLSLSSEEPGRVSLVDGAGEERRPRAATRERE